MDPTMFAALVGQAGNAKNNFVNFLGSQLTGYQERKFTREMYDKSLNDSVALWEMNNAYNTPKAQRERLEDAGLNPALMYGKSGSLGNSASAPGAGNVSQSNFPTAQFDAGMNTLNDLYDLKAKQTQIKGMEIDNKMKWMNHIVESELFAEGALKRERFGEINKKSYQGLIEGKEHRAFDEYKRLRNEGMKIDNAIRRLEWSFFVSNKAARYLQMLTGAIK